MKVVETQLHRAAIVGCAETRDVEKPLWRAVITTDDVVNCHTAVSHAVCGERPPSSYDVSAVTNFVADEIAEGCPHFVGTIVVTHFSVPPVERQRSDSRALAALHVCADWRDRNARRSLGQWPSAPVPTPQRLGARPSGSGIYPTVTARSSCAGAGARTPRSRARDDRRSAYDLGNGRAHDAREVEQLECPPRSTRRRTYGGRRTCLGARCPTARRAGAQSAQSPGALPPVAAVRGRETRAESSRPPAAGFLRRGIDLTPGRAETPPNGGRVDGVPRGKVSTVSGVEHVRGYGLPEVAVGRDGGDASPVVPLLLVVIALAAATIWFVWLPLVDKSANPRRSCEVYVLPSGTTKCVPYWTPEAAAPKQESGRSTKG